MKKLLDKNMLTFLFTTLTAINLISVLFLTLITLVLNDPSYSYLAQQLSGVFFAVLLPITIFVKNNFVEWIYKIGKLIILATIPMILCVARYENNPHIEIVYLIFIYILAEDSLKLYRKVVQNEKIIRR